ncbi:MAG: YceI family protein [Longimicrobiales bacterium]
MKKIYSSRPLIWAVAIVAGSALAGLRATPTVASFRPSPVAGKPAVRFTVAADGNEARYRVREQLAGVELPNDAVGATKGVTGGIVLDKDNRMVRDSSKFTVDLTTLVSDKTRRDGFIKRSTLETDKYPAAVFVPFEARGLPKALPRSGTVRFQLVGDLTIHGITRFTVWTVTARATADSYTGTAKTSFVFADFKMTRPRVPVVLSVNDTIQLEYDFKLMKVNP